MRNILSKKPWAVPLPGADGTPLVTKEFTQDDFIRQYYPSAHKIFDPAYYPDIYRSIADPVYDADGNETGETVTHIYKEVVPRFAFAFQQIITLKQLVHLTGHDIQFDLNTPTEDPAAKTNYQTILDGWLDKGMNHLFYDFAKSVKITGDSALVAYMENGKFGATVLSFLEGDKLYPHYGRDGKLAVFARRYTDYDAEGNPVEYVEVWDKTHLHRLRSASSTDINPVPITFGQGADTYRIEGFVYASPEGARVHGFKEVPVVYLRDNNGPCWAPSQNSSDEFEIAFSQMAHNNKAFGEPILYLQGDNVSADHDINGTIKILTGGPDDKFGYLEGQSASESYMKELDDLHDRIYEQSFIVKPPQLKSGDLPAAALRILYSPAVEKAMNDTQFFNPALQGMKRLFLYGYGLEKEKTIDFASLPILVWIKPYTHVVESAVMADLAIGIQNKFVSRKTASERASFYTMSNEAQRLAEEAKADERADILAQYEAARYQEEINNE